MNLMQTFFPAGQPLHLSFDIGLAVFALLAVFIYSMSLGRRRLIVFLLSAYIARLLFTVLPLDLAGALYSFNTKFFPWVMGGVFVIIVCVVYFLLSGSIVRVALRLSNKGDASWWHVILLSVVTSGFFITTLLHLGTDGSTLSPIIQQVFFRPIALFGWNIAPILALALMRKKEEKHTT